MHDFAVAKVIRLTVRTLYSRITRYEFRYLLVSPWLYSSCFAFQVGENPRCLPVSTMRRRLHLP